MDISLPDAEVLQKFSYLFKWNHENNNGFLFKKKYMFDASKNPVFVDLLQFLNRAWTK